MKPTDVFIRTQKGADAVKNNTQLNPKQRMLCVMINGKITVAEILEQGKRLGIDETILQSLEQNGFIINASVVANTAAANTDDKAQSPPKPAMPTVAAPPPALQQEGISDNYFAAQNLMRQTIADAMGVRSYFFMVKLESAMNLTDLKSLMRNMKRR